MVMISVASFIIYIIAGEYFEQYGLTERQRVLFGIMTVVVIILLRDYMKEYVARSAE